jgi:hypothetical protein
MTFMDMVDDKLPIIDGSLCEFYNGTRAHTHTLHKYFTLETQTGKTNHLFRVAPIIIYSSYIFIVYNTIFIGSHDIQKT